MAPASLDERDYLRRLPLFAGLSDPDLLQLLEMARYQSLETGTMLMSQGDPGEEMFVVLDGELNVTRREGGVENLIAKRGPGEVVGELALLELAPRSASVRATSPVKLLAIDREAFNTLLSCSASAGAAILKTVVGRLRDTEAMLMQREKLAALGTMAAGLAHELNNPAAALKRSSGELRNAQLARDQAAVALFGRPLGGGELAAALGLGRLTADRAAARGESSARFLPDADQEDEVLSLLEALGAGRPWETAPALAEDGWTRSELEGLLASFEPDNRRYAAEWLAADASCRTLLDEIALSTAAISALVGAVKEYSYMDRAPFNEVDVHDGLEKTLTILKHRLKGIEVLRRYDRGLTRIEAHGSELNQVWTNLIDNAIGAMAGSGVLTLRTYGDGERVTVEIQDSGPGIPEQTVARLFEPFFTTKPLGQGTGLGLHITWNVVVLRHGGQIAVSSAPGSTIFKVTLPRTAGQATTAAEASGEGEPP